MKKPLLWMAAMALTGMACAQQDPIALKYAKIIDANLARKHLSILASDEFEGRETGKPGADKAANYLAAQFKKLGLQPPVNGSYFLQIPLIEPTFKVNTFTVNGSALAYGKDFYATGSAPTNTLNATDVVFVGYGSDADLSADLTGKVVIFINEDKPGTPAPVLTGGGRGFNQARQRVLMGIQWKKPALVLAVNPDVATAAARVRSGGRLSIKKDAAELAAVPKTDSQRTLDAMANQAVVFNITPEAANQVLKSSGKTYADLKSAIDAGTPQSLTVKADVSTSYVAEVKDVKAVDVLGYLPGTDLKDEVLVFSAHYDHIGLTTSGTDKVNNGADDDGSGTTGILEIAQAFMQAKKEGHGPRRSILFLGNVGEEKGLLGSEYYTDHPVFPLANTITDLNIDMIGRVGFEYIGKPDSANYVYVIGSAMLSSQLHKINDDANNTYTKLTLDYKYDDPKDPNRFYYRSDHYNFAKHGVPIIFYFNGVHADYHRPGDEISKINFPMLAKRAQLVFFTGWDLANRDQRPPVDAK